MKKSFKFKFLIARAISIFVKQKLNHNINLLYHNISKNYLPDIFSVDFNSFEKQMFLLTQLKKKVLSANECHKNVNSISITFDDGYINNYELAFPILKKYKLPAVFFITTSKINKDNNYLNSFMIKQMNNNELFSFGIHGHNHNSFKDLSNIDLKNEILNCKHFLEDIIQKDVNILSYPNGSVDSRVKDIVQECGISLAFDSTNTSYNPNSLKDFLQIPRVSIWNIDKISSFNNKLIGKWDWIA